MIELKKLAFEALCVSDHDMRKLKPSFKAHIIHNVLGDFGIAKMCEIAHDGVLYYADCKTGSLYNKDGDCMTGNLRMVRHANH